MKVLGFYSTNKKYLLPLVLMAAVFFISQGISVPNFSNPQEPKLSSSQKAKPSSSAVVKSLNQSSQIKNTKTSQFLDLSRNEHQLKNPVVHVSKPQYESHPLISAAVSADSARAPPA